MLKLYKKCLIPENWANSVLLPINKSGSMNDLNNFRGISLIDILNIFWQEFCMIDYMHVPKKIKTRGPLVL